MIAFDIAIKMPFSFHVHVHVPLRFQDSHKSSEIDASVQGIPLRICLLNVMALDLKGSQLFQMQSKCNPFHACSIGVDALQYKSILLFFRRHASHVVTLLGS